AREAGDSPLVAARDGASKVALAITASTLTTVIVFLPLVFLDRGEIRVYMEDAGAAISLCLMASLLVALTIVPLAAGRVLGRARSRPHPFINAVARAYARSLAWSLRSRLAVVLLLALTLAATYWWPVKATGAQASAESNARSVKIELEVDGDYNLDRVEDYFLAFEKILDAHRDELDIEHLYVQSRTNQGAIHLFLTKDHAPTDAIKDRVRALIPTYRDARFRIVADDWSGRPESSVLGLRLTGRDPDLLREYANVLASRVRGVEGIRDVHIETGSGKEEVRIVIDRTLAANQGLPPGGVAQAIAFAFRGRELPKITESEKEVEVYIQLEEKDRRSLEDLKQLELETLTGTRVSLGTVARFETSSGYHTINREHGKRYIEVNLESDRTSMTEVRRRVASILDDFRLPVGYQVSYGDAFVSLEENQSAVKNAITMSILLIYLLLGSLFESYLLPITILVSVPLAFMGSYWLMYVLGTPMDYAAYIGLIILIGIVVN
ncbi:MAG: efflux RND transporter permease subunit, partial [Myxococcales bacterium]|nr:efflux RND transporter permease subunit [Myxococcales bacterium]